MIAKSINVDPHVWELAIAKGINISRECRDYLEFLVYKDSTKAKIMELERQIQKIKDMENFKESDDNKFLECYDWVKKRFENKVIYTTEAKIKSGLRDYMKRNDIHEDVEQYFLKLKHHHEAGGK